MRYINKFLFLALVVALASCNKQAPTTEFFEGDNFYRFASATADALENAPEPVSVVVFYSTQTEQSGSVDFEVVDGSAVQGVNFNVLNSGNTLSFDKEGGYSASVDIELIDNEEFLGQPLTFDIVLSNGTNGKVGFEGPSDINSSMTFTIIDDDCPTNLLEGEYTSVTTGTSTDGCCPGSVTSMRETVTVTALGEGNYTVSDFSAGLYLDWYGPDGGAYGIVAGMETDGTLNGTFSNICNELNGTFGEPFNTDVTLTGSVDPSTGVITYTWVNGFDDTATVTLTPK